MTNTEIRERIAELIHSERDRRLLYRRFIDGIGIERLAEEHDLSVRQCNYIIKKGKSVIFGHSPSP